ncbi:MAG: DUF6655 family protein [Candidatus Brocadiia bacterium]
MAKHAPMAAVLAAALVAGCTTVRTTEPPRTATEQLLISTAVDRAMDGRINLGPLSGRRVFVDAAHFEGVDKAYAIGALGAELSGQRARLVAERGASEVVAAIRAGALSVDRLEVLVGLPSLSLPTPFGGDVETPEIALLKRSTQWGTAKLALNAYETQSGEPVLREGPVTGKSYYTVWTFLGLPLRFTNIPEKKPRRWWWPFGA